MLSWKQKGSFCWDSVGHSRDKQLQELPQHSLWNGNKDPATVTLLSHPSVSQPRALTCLIKSTKPFLASCLLPDLTSGKRNSWESQLRNSVCRGSTQWKGWCLSYSSFYAGCIFPCSACFLSSELFPLSWINPACSPASSLTFILAHFH